MQCENSLRQYINEWQWLYSNKTLFTETSDRPILAHRSLFADLYSVTKENRERMNYNYVQQHG